MAEIIEISCNPEMKGMVELQENVVFARPDGKELALQLLKPMWSSGGKGFPLVVFIQGSAWNKPNQFRQLPQLSMLARRGYVIASVTHRSAFETPAPGFLKDVKAAVRFLRAHAVKYDIDPARVCAWGTSSGGNTALLLGMTGGDPAFEDGEWPDVSSEVQAVVDCFGPTDLIRMTDARFVNPDLISPQHLELVKALGGGSIEEGRERFRQISPICYVEKGRALPPILMLHGDADSVVAFDDSAVLYERLTDCGFDAQLVRVKNAPHEGSFWSMELLELIFGFIQKKLG